MPLFVAALKPISGATNDPAWVMRDKGGGQLDHSRVADVNIDLRPGVARRGVVYSSDTTVLDPIITRLGLSWGFDRIFYGDDEPHRVVPPAGAVRRGGCSMTSSPVASDSRGFERGTSSAVTVRSYCGDAEGIIKNTSRPLAKR